MFFISKCASLVRNRAQNRASVNAPLDSTTKCDQICSCAGDKFVAPNAAANPELTLFNKPASASRTKLSIRGRSKANVDISSSK
jgi:hypothetical protein